MGFFTRGSGLTKPQNGAQLNRAHPLARDIVGYWALNEGTGKSVTNLANGRIGTFGSAPLWVGSTYGTATNYTASTNNVIDTGDDTIYRFGTGDFTIAAGVQTSTGGTHVAIGKAGGNDYWLGVNTTAAFFITGGGVNTGTVADGKPHMLMGTRNRGVITLYLDGRAVGSASNTNGASPTGNLTIGNFGGTSFFFTGRIWTAAVWNRGVSDGEAREFAAAPFSMLLPVRNRSWFLPVAAGTVVGTVFQSSVIRSVNDRFGRVVR